MRSNSFSDLIYIYLVLVVLVFVEVSSALRSTNEDTCRQEGCRCQIKTLECHCYNPNQVVVLQSLPYYLEEISLVNCHSVQVKKGSILTLNDLYKVSFSNIGTLDLQDGSFSRSDNSSQYTVTISATNISSIPARAFSGKLTSLQMNNVEIGSIKSLAFSNLKDTNGISFKNCLVGPVERKAFTGFQVNSFEWTDGTIERLTSYALYDIQVENRFTFDSLRIQQVDSLAIVMTGPTSFKIQECTIDYLSGNSFQVQTRGSVFINHNYFKYVGTAAFTGIGVDGRFMAHSVKQDFMMENVTLISFDNEALLINVTGFKPTIDRIVIQSKCSCSQIPIWTDNLVRYTPNEKVDGIQRVMWCQTTDRTTLVEEYQEKSCGTFKGSVFLIVLGILFGLVFIGAGVGLGYFLFRRYGKKYAAVPVKGPVMIVPEGRTYRETEVHVIVETAEPLENPKLTTSEC